MSLLKVAGTTASSGTLYVDDVFSVYLYTGTGATQTITNGIDLAGKGGLVWCKMRSSAGYNHALVDTARGASYQIHSNTTGTGPGASTDFTSFNATGFTLGAPDATNNFNASAETYASWTFRKAEKFFDVVTYTGTGSARTIAHSLGVAPGMVIVKRTDASANWQVYSNGLTSAAYSIQLNLTNAQASAPTVWNSTAPTSSVFSVGTSADVNASGGTYVAYLYAHDTDADGIIQCGSFTYSGSPVSVNLGWEPQFIIEKAADRAIQWSMYDTMRGMPSVGSNTAALFPNTGAAESVAGYPFHPTATGFIVDASYYNNPTTVIYMAIRMPNKPPTSGTQVYNAIARTGTGATAAVTGLGFTPDFVFPMGRSATSGYASVFDRLRGVNIFMDTSNAGSETTAFQSLMSFNMDGFTLGSSTTYLNTNVSARTYINWSFKRAPGFFDEVCYTGTGSAMTIAHNLGVVPEMMIVKQRNSSFARVWVVYTSAVGNTKYLVLNTHVVPVISPDVWNNTTPTASVFSIGNDSYVNDSATATYVAYLFATLAGISKVGSYTGNGTGQVIACGFSAGARFVLIKRTDAVGDWYTFDSARGLTVGSSPYLLLNSTAAETTGNNGVYASTGGFTLGSTASTTTNINAATYIFLAVA
jgi:hypothetical protein